MRCDDFEALVSDYLDGDLDPLTRQRAQAHAAICPNCAEVLDGVMRVRGALRCLVDLPEGAAFRLRLSSCLSQELDRSLEPRVGSLAVALAVAAALATVLWPTRPAEPPTSWALRAPAVVVFSGPALPRQPVPLSLWMGAPHGPARSSGRTEPMARPVSY